MSAMGRLWPVGWKAAIGLSEPRCYRTSMKKGWVGLALIVAIAGIFAVSTYRDFAKPVPYQGCFQHEGDRLVLRDGRLMVDGVDVGSFRYSKGDATKGPDNISVSASAEASKSIGINPRRLWIVRGNGLQLPTDDGYQMALPCPT